MQALQSIHVASLLDTLLSLSTAFVLGTLIGIERQYRQRTAGLRTNVLVAVGAAVFVDLVVEAALATAFVLAANTLLRPLVNAIDRKPIDVAAVEVTRTVHLVAERTAQSRALALLVDELSRIRLPVRDLDVQPFGDDAVQIEATLAATSLERAELDALAVRLAGRAEIRQAFWSSSTTE